MFWVEHAFHPILTAVSSSLFKRGWKITLDGGLEWLADGDDSRVWRVNYEADKPKEAGFDD